MNRLKKIIIPLIFVLHFTVAGYAAQDSDNRKTLFAQACAAFSEAGKVEESEPEKSRELYKKAAIRYEKLIDMGVDNGGLYYNLGNTYFRLGDIGKAILQYKRAKLFMPYDQNLLNNLARAQAIREDKFKQAEKTRILKTLLFWHYDISFSTRQIIFSAFFIAFWLGLIARLLLKGKKIPPSWILYVCAIIWVCLLSSLIIQPLQIEANREGVITAYETTARKGDGDNYQPAFTQPLHAGTEFTLIEKRPEWYEIRLQDGRTSWVKKDAVELVRK